METVPIPTHPLLGLCVGNDDYEAPRKRLFSCERDASRVRDKLLELGWHAENVKLTSNTTCSQLLLCLDEFVKRVRAASVAQTHTGHLLLFVYFAGHAAEKQKSLHLFGTDSSIKESINVEEQLVRPLNRIHLSGGRKLVIILCFDCCREDLDNLTWRCHEDEDGREALATRGNGSLENRLFAAANDFLFLWACDPGRVASESRANSAGLFTEELLKHMGDNESIADWFTKVQNAVSQRTGGIQRPCLCSRLTFPIVLKGAGTRKRQLVPNEESFAWAALKAAAQEWATQNPAAAAASAEAPLPQPVVLQGVALDLIKGLGSGRESEFEYLGRLFRQCVRARIHSFTQPVKYDVTIGDSETSRRSEATNESEGEAQMEAMRRLLPQLASEEIVRQILEFGIEGIRENGAKRASIAVQNCGLKAAVDWAVEHMQ